MSPPAAYDLWWKNAVIYCVDVELYADSNGDGVGDFPGLTGKVDYLAGLGATCLWLMRSTRPRARTTATTSATSTASTRASAPWATWSSSSGRPASGASG